MKVHEFMDQWGHLTDMVLDPRWIGPDMSPQVAMLADAVRAVREAAPLLAELETLREKASRVCRWTRKMDGYETSCDCWFNESFRASSRCCPDCGKRIVEEEGGVMTPLIDDTNTMISASYLLPDPGGEVVRNLLYERSSLRRIAAAALAECNTIDGCCHDCGSDNGCTGNNKCVFRRLRAALEKEGML